ncbi:MAG: rhodanese-like domain-containing protein [Pseudomonadota bacterium]|nr:rhodanese-like domain-containing protein [Pseudomonadota bacterium]
MPHTSCITRCLVISLALWAYTSVSPAIAQESAELRNPSIDMQGYLQTSRAAAAHRESRRVSELEFLRLSREPGTIILDARSKEKFDLLHVKGAINLSFPDITVDSLGLALPDPNTRILIYCNNNFSNAERPFPSKSARASLNLSTFISLYTYGYRNVYELGPLIDIAATKLPFESSTADRRPAIGSR